MTNTYKVLIISVVEFGREGSASNSASIVQNIVEFNSFIEAKYAYNKINSSQKLTNYTSTQAIMLTEED